VRARAAASGLVLMGLSAGGPARALPPGRYGMELVTATRAKVPVLGQTKGASHNLLLVDVIDDGAGGLVQEHRPCAVAMRGAGSAAMVIPEAFLKASGVKRYPIRVTPEGAYTADLGADHVGYDPRRGALPTALTDAAVTDWDADGRPAATIRLDLPVIGEVELYVVQHAHLALSGAVAADGSVKGAVRFEAFAQRTLGASHKMFDASPEMWPDPAASSFWMAPVPAGTTCATLGAALSAAARGAAP
jgi:hypothetical protein